MGSECFPQDLSDMNFEEQTGSFKTANVAVTTVWYVP